MSTNTNTNSTSEKTIDNHEDYFNTISMINEKKMKQRLMDRIKADLDINPIEFLENLTRNDAYIVGNFILEVIHNTRYAKINDESYMEIISDNKSSKNLPPFISNDPLAAYLKSIAQVASFDSKNGIHTFIIKNKLIVLILNDLDNWTIPLHYDDFLSIFKCSFGGKNGIFDSGKHTMLPIGDLTFKIDNWFDIEHKTAVFSLPPKFDLKNKMNLKKVIDAHIHYFIKRSPTFYVDYHFTMDNNTYTEIKMAIEELIPTRGLYAKKDYEGILKLFSELYPTDNQIQITYSLCNKSTNSEYRLEYMYTSDSRAHFTAATFDELLKTIFDSCKQRIFLKATKYDFSKYLHKCLVDKWTEE